MNKIIEQLSCLWNTRATFGGVNFLVELPIHLTTSSSQICIVDCWYSKRNNGWRCNVGYHAMESQQWLRSTNDPNSWITDSLSPNWSCDNVMSCFSNNRHAGSLISIPLLVSSRVCSSEKWWASVASLLYRPNSLSSPGLSVTAVSASTIGDGLPRYSKEMQTRLTREAPSVVKVTRRRRTSTTICVDDKVLWVWTNILNNNI